MAHMLPPRHMLPPEQGPNPQLVGNIVQQLKINGVFDEMRKECLADIDTKPAFLNLKQRVEGHVKSILANQEWSPALNKNQLRSRIRESVMQSGILNEGVDRILYQVFSSKAVPIFLPKIQDFVKDNREELMKDFLPPPMEMPSLMMNPPPFGPMPIPVLPEMQPELFPPPMPPNQPPPPETPLLPGPSDQVEPEELLQQDQTEQIESIHEMTEEVLTYEDQEFYVKDVATEDVFVKAIHTPSPQPSTPGSTEEGAPKIPEDAVNPLRSLIQTLLVSKQTILETDGENNETVTGRMEVKEEKVQVEGYSPTIDPSHIEGFTDDEEEVEEYIPAPGPRTPTDGKISYEPSESKDPYTPSPEHASPLSPESEPHTPPDVYSPLSPGQVLDDNEYHSNEKPMTPSKVESGNKDSDSRMTDENSTPAYDPSKFSYQQMSDSTPLHEDDNAQSPPSPTEVTDTTERSQHTDGAPVFSEESKYDTDMRERRLLESRKRKKRRRSSSDSSATSSSSGSVSSSPSSDDEKNEITSHQEHVVEQVEEMVEEIEVVEEFTSGGSAEEGEQIRSDENGQEVEDEVRRQQSPIKSPKEKKKKKKTKKRKVKKPKKRARTSSISSGEITSSGELSSDSSSGSSRPTRPTHPPRKKSLDLEELEERRRILRDDRMQGRPYWPNTASSSEYLSSPGRPHRPFSPRRPYSPDYRRYDDDLGYGPPPGPHFRDRPMFPGEYHPRHSRFSPPPYRRSPPHRYSPGPRMDYPRIPFGSPRSPPRRPYSPPHMMGGYPRERPPFPPPHHRWGSPPRQGPRRLSRSPPPGLRRDDAPGPSRY